MDEDDDSDVIDCDSDLMGQDSPEVPPEVALIDFQNKLESYRVLFRYGFLAPPVTEQELENWDAEMQEELAKAAMPEMGALWYIRYTHTILTLWNILELELFTLFDAQLQSAETIKTLFNQLKAEFLLPFPQIMPKS